MSRFKDDAPANAVVRPEDVPATFIDRAGNSVELASYRGRFVVLVVVRGLPAGGGEAFCAYCLAQANGLTANYPQFQQRKAEVLLVVPGSREVAEAFARQASPAAADTLPYPLVVDPDAVAVGQLGIRGDLAKPSTFILDAGGKVVYAYVGKSPSDRPSVKALLAELDRLGSK